MSETKKAKRHDWSDGLVQHCRNAGCQWRRRAYSREPREWQYSRAGSAWLLRYFVPECEGTR